MPSASSWSATTPPPARIVVPFYEPAGQTRRLAKGVDKFVCTLVHGSWPNLVEVELSVLVRQCLKRRLRRTSSRCRAER